MKSTATKTVISKSKALIQNSTEKMSESIATSM